MQINEILTVVLSEKEIHAIIKDHLVKANPTELDFSAIRLCDEIGDTVEVCCAKIEYTSHTEDSA